MSSFRGARLAPVPFLLAVLAAGAYGESSDWLMGEPPVEGADGLVDLERGARAEHRVLDLRLGIGVVPGLRVNENISKAGVTTGYEWKGETSQTAEYALTGVADLARWRRWGGLALGAEFSFADYRITPDTYQVAGASFANNSGDNLHADYPALRLLVGWTSPVLYTPAGALHLEVLPHIGGGPVWVETQGFDPVGNPSLTRGHGWLLDYGVRAGVYLSEDFWVVGIDGGWREAHGEPKLDNADGSTSTLFLDQSGLTGQLQLGLRF